MSQDSVPWTGKAGGHVTLVSVKGTISQLRQNEADPIIEIGLTLGEQEIWWEKIG